MPRPRKSTGKVGRGETCTEQIRIRLTPADKARIKRAADRIGGGVAAYVLASTLMRVSVEEQR